VGVKHLLGFRGQVGHERLVPEIGPFHAEHARPGEIDVQDQSVGIKGEVADRREVIQLAVALLDALHLLLALAEFLVLQFQFDLVNGKLMEQLLDVFRLGAGLVLVQLLQDFFSLLPQLLELLLLLLVVHRAPVVRPLGGH